MRDATWPARRGTALTTVPCRAAGYAEMHLGNMRRQRCVAAAYCFLSSGLHLIASTLALRLPLLSSIIRGRRESAKDYFHVTNVHSRVFRTQWRSCARARPRRSCAHRFLHSAHDARCSISNRLSKLQGVGEKERHSVQICCVTGHAPRYGCSTRLTAAGADPAVASASGVLGDWFMT